MKMKFACAAALLALSGVASAGIQEVTIQPVENGYVVQVHKDDGSEDARYVFADLRALVDFLGREGL